MMIREFFKALVRVLLYLTYFTVLFFLACLIARLLGLD